jgi:ATP-dependent Clp protease ATP-binding subunit ClpC
MFKEFTDGAKHAVMQAQTEAQARSDDHVGGEHLLLGVMRAGTGLAADLLGGVAVTPEAGRRAVEELYGPPPAVPPGESPAATGIDPDRVDAGLTESFGEAATAPEPTPFDDAAKAALVAAVGAAGEGRIGTEHVLLGLLDDPGGRAVKVLEHLGVDAGALAERARGGA